ncbi:hypothetical protein OPV22_030476 [Ensete ventricosum]|uniref:Uncharacterized protein n=1 Tax=Ensete ventricosum TaxID=4639 RepID=A0AAV8Q8X3_ENSVE|nr:hypothetical protein OPV22_030476 [Ensete ventricosum]
MISIQEKISKGPAESRRLQAFLPSVGSFYVALSSFQSCGLNPDLPSTRVFSLEEAEMYLMAAMISLSHR